MIQINSSLTIFAAPRKILCRARSLRACVLTIAVACGFILGDAGEVAAKGSFAGTTNLLVNDAWGDGNDRWQTGSFQQSFFTHRADSSAIDYLEWRGRAKIISPWGKHRHRTDRPYSAAYGLGLFAHGLRGKWYVRGGGEVIAQGKQTRLHKVQERLHRVASYKNGYNYNERNDPIVENRVSGRLKFEAGYALRPARTILLRPYLAARLGGDHAVYMGADLVIGELAHAAIWNRDVVTGQLLSPRSSRKRASFNLIAGADVIRVNSSVHLPSEFNIAVEPKQSRARIGVRADLGSARIFLGQAWLSKQFVGQDERQRVGAVSFSLGF